MKRSIPSWAFFTIHEAYAYCQEESNAFVTNMHARSITISTTDHTLISMRYLLGITCGVKERSSSS